MPSEAGSPSGEGATCEVLIVSTEPVAEVFTGFGLAYLPEGMVKADVGEGRLLSVLERWCDSFPGYHLYYSSRRQHAPAFALMVDAFRYCG